MHAFLSDSASTHAGNELGKKKERCKSIQDASKSSQAAARSAKAKPAKPRCT